MRLKPIRKQALRNTSSLKKIPLQKLDPNVIPKNCRPKRTKQTNTKTSGHLGAKYDLKKIFDDENIYLKGISNSFKATSTPQTSFLDMTLNNDPKNLQSGIFYRVEPYRCDFKVLNKTKIFDDSTVNHNQVNLITSAEAGQINQQECSPLKQKVTQSPYQETKKAFKTKFIVTSLRDDKNDKHLTAKSELNENNSNIIDDIPLINFELPSVSEPFHNHQQDMENIIQKIKMPHINRQRENRKSKGGLGILACKNCMLNENIVQKGKKVEFLTENKKIENKKLEKESNDTLSSYNQISKSSIYSDMELDIHSSIKKNKGQRKGCPMLQKSTQIDFVQDILLSEPRRNRRRNTGGYTEIKNKDNNSISRDTLKEILAKTAIRDDNEDFSLYKTRQTIATKKEKQVGKNKYRKQKETHKKKANIGRRKKLSGKQLLKLCSNGKDPIDLLASKSKLTLKVFSIIQT